MISKASLLQQYDEILGRGCLSPEEQAAFQRGEQVQGIVVQESGGSSGRPPLRLPRTQAEIQWLAAKLLTRFSEVHESVPTRIALLGGISHTEAQQRLQIDQPIHIEDFAGHELAELDEFDPEVISTYPSFAREIQAHAKLRLESLKAIKLGGEPIFPSDLVKLRERFGGIGIIEQFGSTEMPALAFRTHGPSPDTGYQLSTDRYAFDLKETRDWQPLVVTDRFGERAFPIEGWFDTGDDVLVQDGRAVGFRRRDDPAFAVRDEIDALFQSGCVNLQAMPRESLLLCSPGSSVQGSRIKLGESTLDVRFEAPYRLVDSNKMPLVVDTDRLDHTRLYR